MMRKLEPVRPVHDPWIELNKENNIQWTPHREDTYCGSQAGGRCGPSSKMVSIAKSTESLAQLFLSIFTIKLFEYVSKMTHIYAYEEWVTEQKRFDPDGNEAKTSFFVPHFCRLKKDKPPDRA